MNMDKFGLTMGLALAVLAAGAMTESEKTVAHRRDVRAKIAAGGPKVAENFIRDDDAAVRRYALWCVFEKNSGRGKELAKQMESDTSDSVKALARELTRDRKGATRAPTPLPLSQNPLNDHELISVKSIKCSGGNEFLMPPKPDCDEVEIWLGVQKAPLTIWINDFSVAAYDPAIDGNREFRFDATKFLKWGEKNEVLIYDQQGRDREYPFTVEIFKCGK